MKSNIKKLTALITASAMGFMGALGGYSPLNLKAAASGTCGDNLTWNIDSEGTLTISGTGDMYDYDVSEAPWDNTPYYNLNIDDGVTSIGTFAFRGALITEAIIPGSVKTIGRSAFSDADMMNVIVMSEGVKVIGEGAFGSCDSLSFAAVPESVTSIGYRAFDGSSMAVNLFVHSNGCAINDSEATFSGVSAVYAPSTSTSAAYAIKYDIPYFALDTSVPLDYMYITGNCGENLTWQADSDGLLNITGSGAMYDYQYDSGNAPWSHLGIKVLELDGSITHIGDYAFMYTDITSVSIPDSVTTVGASAFRECSKISAVTFPESVASIGNMAFYGDYDLKKVTILNPECEIYDSKYAIPGAVIYGYSGSTAEAYANTYGNEFVSIGSFETTTATTATYTTAATTSTTVSTESGELRNVISCGTVEISHKSLAIFDYQVQIPVYIVNSDSFASLDFGIGYPEEFTVVTGIMSDWLKDAGFTTGTRDYTDLNAYWNGFAFDGEEYIEGDGELCTITLKLPRTAQPGDKWEISVLNVCPDGSSSEIFTPGGALTPNVSNGFISVVGEAVTTTSTSESATTTTTTTTSTTTTSTTTTTTTSATTTTSQPDISIEWGIDNWNFRNSSTYFTHWNYYMKDSYLEKLRENLSNTDWYYVNQWMNDNWGGSCYGMSSLVLLANVGMLPYSDWTAGADSLYDMETPAQNSDIESLINYYQMLQIKDAIQQQYRSVPSRGSETNIKAIITALESGEPLMLGYKQNSWGGHAVVAYDVSYGSWSWDGVTYQGKIEILDPNSSMEYNERYCIYFNTGTYNWTIPAYSLVKSVNGAVFNYIGNDLDVINSGGYLTGTNTNFSGSYIARIDAPEIAANHSVQKVKRNNNSFSNMNAGPDDIVADTFYVAGGESEGVAGYLLKDAEAGYSVSQSEAQPMELSIDYENCLLSASSAAGSDIIFDKSGYVQVKGEAASYEMRMVFDNGSHTTSWYGIEVTGENADSAVLEQVSDGYILSGDNLSNVSVNAWNDSHDADVVFSSDYAQVLLYEIDEDTIGVAVDTDSDGTYDTTIFETTAPETIKGDINGDGIVNIADATLVLSMYSKSAAGLPLDEYTEAQILAADIDGDGQVLIADSAAILKFYAQSSAGMNPTWDNAIS